MTATKLIGIVAGILNFISIFPYVISILRGKTKPNRVSWGIWAVLGGAITVNYALVGDPDALWVAVTVVVSPIIMALLSIRYGESGWTWADVVCLIGALASWILWWKTGDPFLGLVLALIVDFCGYVPTLIKMYKDPLSEDLATWTITSIANIINCFAVKTWSFGTGLFPVHYLVMSIVILTLLWRPRTNKNPAHSL